MRYLSLLDLQAVELDRCFAAEHVDQDFELALGRVDFVDGAVEALERSVDNIDDFTDSKVNLVFRLFLTHALHDLFDFSIFDRAWIIAGTDEAGHGWGVTYDVPGVLGKLHLDQDVTLEDLLLDDFALAVLDLDHLLFWYQNLKDLILHIQGIGALADRLGDLFLVAAVGVDGVPLFACVVAF